MSTDESNANPWTILLSLLPRTVLVGGIVSAIVVSLLLTFVALYHDQPVSSVSPWRIEFLAPRSKPESAKLAQFGRQLDSIRSIVLLTSFDYFHSRVRTQKDFSSVARFFVEYVKLGGDQDTLTAAIKPQRLGPRSTGVEIHDFVSGANFNLFFNNYLTNSFSTEGDEINYQPRERTEFKTVLAESRTRPSILLLANDELLNTIESASELLEQVNTADNSQKWTNLPEQFKVSLRAELEGYVFPFWRSQYVCIYRKDILRSLGEAEKGPSSWREVHRLAVHVSGLKGRIGFVHPESGYSSGGRRAFYAYLASWLTEADRERLRNDEDYRELENWHLAEKRLNEFLPNLNTQAGDPTYLLQQIRQGEIVLTVYALDYFRFFEDRDFFDDLGAEVEFGYSLLDLNPTGSDAYIVVTRGSGGSESVLQVAERLVAYDIQGDVAREMFQFPGIEMWEKLATKELWVHAPWEVVRTSRIGLKNHALVSYIKDEIGPRLAYIR